MAVGVGHGSRREGVRVLPPDRGLENWGREPTGFGRGLTPTPFFSPGGPLRSRARPGDGFPEAGNPPWGPLSLCLGRPLPCATPQSPGKRFKEKLWI